MQRSKWQLDHEIRYGRLIALFNVPEISVQSAHHNHSDHAGQEQDDHERVDDREPVNLTVFFDAQVFVPTVSPRSVGFLK